MAISKDTKTTQVAELTDLLAHAKMTVGAKYSGLSVADMQALRAKAREAGVTIKVVKNRLVRVALSHNDTFKNTDTSLLTDQLLYAISAEDEVAPAQVIAQFAKTHDSLKLVCGFDGDGNALDTARVTELANLPTKDQLRGQLVSVIAAPLTGIVGVLSGNLRSVLYALNARAEQL
ncbi:MAG TPA: 50S ribosomal protein L10 [Candidatus Saccharimonadales bacterium]|jgi:large subunit ribosomal protein L10|nr:50S ribosomal protein L10 [Candidatus Saccharimonadales bacterium]